jgi:hypothetical protein
MSMPMPTARTAVLNLLLHFLYPLSVGSNNIPDIAYPIKIRLQLIDLPQNFMKSRDFGIRNRNRIACSVVLLLCHHLRLLAQIVQTSRYLLQQSIEVPAKRGERGTIKQKKTL